MFTLDEQSQMVATVIRQWCKTTLTPRIPALEAGTEMPFDLMKNLAKAFGFDAMLGGSVKKRIAKLRAGEVQASDEKLSGGSPMMMFTVVKELSRVSPGFAMSIAAGLPAAFEIGLSIAMNHCGVLRKMIGFFERHECGY